MTQRKLYVQLISAAKIFFIHTYSESKVKVIDSLSLMDSFGL